MPVPSRTEDMSLMTQLGPPEVSSTALVKEFTRELDAATWHQGCAVGIRDV